MANIHRSPRVSSARNAVNSAAKPALDAETMKRMQDFLDEAEICCEHARLAGRQKRFKAACGLFTTAQGFYRQALAQVAASDGSGAGAAIRESLRHLEVEMAAYGELANSMARPLQRANSAAA